MTAAPAMSVEALQAWTAHYPAYGEPSGSKDPARADAVRALWGARAVPLLAPAGAGGRFAGAARSCPPRSCAGYLELQAGASSLAWRNTDSFENLVCMDGVLEIEFFDPLPFRFTLARFDLLSIPPGVRHRLHNPSDAPVRFVSALNGPAASSYPAVFQETAHGIADGLLRSLSVTFDAAPGAAFTAEEAERRTTRFATLQPYKRQLQANPNLPPEATETLTAGNVYPLIVPEGHQGRSRNAPLKGLPGLYLAIAECEPGDGPLPHAHFDTQESFVVLDGEWDMTCGFDDEFRLPVSRFDFIAIPPKVVRGFRNTGTRKGQLLAFIQGQEKMSDLVAFPNRIGRQIEERFGRQVVEAFEKINMTFDAEQR